VVPGFDLFVFPTRFDYSPYAVIEAMTAGVPVLATRVGAIPEMVEDGVSGYLVAREDPAVYADHLLRLLRDPERARAMGRRGRERAQARFTWTHVAAAMADRITAGVTAGAAARGRAGRAG
jgi:glycosyltransferase involved in cell wall biosynthesis